MGPRVLVGYVALVAAVQGLVAPSRRAPGGVASLSTVAQRLATVETAVPVKDLSSGSSPSVAAAAAREAAAASGAALATGGGEGSKKMKKKVPLALALWRFTRPHTLIGSTVSIVSVFLLSAASAGGVCTARWAASLATALVPALLVNVFITGLNQLCDVEIDKINKPDLPVAAGDLAFATGAWTCALSLALTVGLAQALPLATDPLRVALYGSALLGAAYSAPPVRLKRSPFFAAFAIVAVRGAIVNACFYAHALQTAFTDPTLARSFADARVSAVAAFFAIFGIAIALMKDVPDVEGDRKASIKTFSTALGQQRVFDMAATLVTATLAATAAVFGVAACLAQQVSLGVMRAAVAAATVAIARDAHASATGVDARDLPQVQKAYMRLWKSFYACYLILPFAR